MIFLGIVGFLTAYVLLACLNRVTILRDDKEAFSSYGNDLEMCVLIMAPIGYVIINLYHIFQPKYTLTRKSSVLDITLALLNPGKLVGTFISRPLITFLSQVKKDAPSSPLAKKTKELLDYQPFADYQTKAERLENKMAALQIELDSVKKSDEEQVRDRLKSI